MIELIPVLQAILWIFSGIFAVYMSYYGILTLFAFTRGRKYPHQAPRCRFAVLCAARNEEAVIGELVHSLKQQDYPEELFEVFVIPNNCTDNTAGAAAQAGAKLLECAFPVRSKGDVLRQVISMLSAKDEFDAIVVFDADNVVEPGFLAAMNDAWCAGARAAQGYRDSKNPHDTAISGCYSIYYWMVNRFYSHARNAAGLSAIINGSGFMADLNLLRRMGGWNTYTMTEDIEFTTKCILSGERVWWVPEARTYDEQPLTFAQSWRQRCRWSTGLFQNIERYFKPLLSGSLRRGSRACLDQMVFLLAPIMQLAWLVSLLLGGMLDVLRVHYDLFPTTELYTSLFRSVGTSFLTSAALAVLVVLIERKRVLPMMRGVLAYWAFIMSWIPINVVCLFKRDTSWKPIAHTRKVSLSELNKK